MHMGKTVVLGLFLLLLAACGGSAPESDVVADSTTDTLTFAGTGGTTITTNAGTDTVTIDTPAAGVSAGFSIAMSIAL